ncbi:FecR family protein [Asticcacaulis excentricus]|uniref:Anti-FecI sigma factor, FecR n=1 Tax=Asticcacaulis excentricus (strain ATCC 15261 / DSM 4724 / KCTC 12464 / NCIMB 9791 / VKM B-1370 / CB 48) TaxID=573065 RepID=E8RUG4_ASTEC|nr:FecR domain-containing protein [Asticcacaulis excentricus]ADU14052.1 anti-FecI sigma factor, FecR [Asticcacaulis excentricus CB 48]
MTAPTPHWNRHIKLDSAREAAEWLVKLEEGPLDPQTEAQFAVWLSADPAHAAALSRAREAWRQAEALRPGREALMGRQVYGAQVLEPVLSAMRQPLAAAACLLLGISGMAIYGSVTAADLRTGPGEVRTFRLADGSQLTLDGNSAVDLAFNTGTRRIALRKGAAYVIAAPRQGAETRPFVVVARGGESQALGTEFAVEYLDTGVRVTVTEHLVRVSHDHGQAVLAEGQSVIYGLEGWQAVQTAPSLQAATWRDGRMVFDRAPLKDVVAQLNRYRRDRLYIAGTGLAERRVSGVFDTRDPQNALSSITTGLKLRSLDTPAGTVIYP